ncbi:MAG: hypothetical protein C4558_00885 [Dehalococcoidia bacterium]|nr:MAG: hypothetical protein C4558_00885 [Dehalococcoidia bacterium]
MPGSSSNDSERTVGVRALSAAFRPMDRRSSTKAFGFQTSNLPCVAFNSLRTETEQSEHRGLMNLMKGTLVDVPKHHRHAPKIPGHVFKRDAMDVLTLASMLHRRFDAAILTPRHQL